MAKVFLSLFINEKNILMMVAFLAVVITSLAKSGRMEKAMNGLKQKVIEEAVLSLSLTKGSRYKERDPFVLPLLFNNSLFSLFKFSIE